MSESLFPMTVNHIKNNFIRHVLKRESTLYVNRILEQHPDVQTAYQLYNYLRHLPINSPEIHIFENAYDEYIAIL
jgi:hypothetical protein